MLKRFALLLPLFLLLFAARPECAIHGRLEWLQRVKPSMRADCVGLLGDMIVTQSGMNDLVFIDPATGKRLWQFALTDPAALYGTFGQEILAVSGRWIHLIDPYKKTRVWTFTMPKDAPAEILLTSKGKIVVAYGPKERDFISAKTGEKVKAAPGEETRPAAKICPADSPVTAPGVRWEAGKLLGAGWSFPETGSVEETAAAWKDRIAAIDEKGMLYILDPASGTVAGQIDAKKLVDMRFWDERPEFIGNFSMSRLHSNGGSILIALHSALASIKIVPYPTEIALKEAGEATDKWALDKAIQLWEEKNFREAVVRFQQAVEVWPNSAPIRLFLGMAYAAVDQTDSAITELEKAHELAPDDQDIVSNLVGNYVGKILAMNPVTETAGIEKIYQRVLTLHPTSKMGYIGYAELLLGSNRYEEAKAVLLSARNYGFFGADMFALVLTTQYLTDDDKGALQTAHDMKLYFPETRNVHSIRGKLYCRDGRYAECMEELRLEDDAAGEDERSLFPFIVAAGREFYYANALGLTGQYKRAIARLKSYYEEISKKTETEPSTPEEQMALMLRETEEGYIVPTLFALAHFHYRLGEGKKSLEYLNLIEKSGEKEADVRSFLGYFLALNGARLEDAFEMTRGALADSSNAIHLKNHAVALWKLKRHGEAEEYFKRALDTGEIVELLHYDYGCMLLELGRKKEGKEQIKIETQLSPELYEPKRKLRGL